jgi:basic membrane protein A
MPPRSKGEGFWVIAADADQSQLGAEQQLAVSAKGVDTAVYALSEQVVNGTFAGGEQSLGLAEGGVDLLNPGGLVPEEVMAIVERYKQAIIDGAITVPADEEELAAYTPTAPDALPAAAATPAAGATPAA